jgi:tagatose 1,6-diphosphate aldolase GatY/KbaY
MPFADTTQMLHAAQAGGYAVGAFNAENMEMAQAIVLAAQEARAPVILQTTPSGTQTHSYIGVMFRRLRSAPVCRWRCIWIMGTALNYAHRRCARGIPA